MHRQPDSVPEPSPPTPAPAASKKKKKKKNNKKKKKKNGNHDDDGLDEIDRALIELGEAPIGNLAGASTSTATNTTNNGSNNGNSNGNVAHVSKVAAVLAVDRRHLNPRHELKRLFGSDVVQAEERRSKQAAGGSRGHRRGTAVARGGKGLFVEAKAHWPPVTDQGLGCEFVESAPDGASEVFRFTEDEVFAQANASFLHCVESGDPETIVLLLRAFPYNPRACLQLAEIIRTQGSDAAAAAEQVERCILALEAALHPDFDVTTGTCRLPYAYRPNRIFYLALMKHLQNLSRRGCPRTALEVARLVYSLDPDADPVGVLLCLEYHALRAREYAFMLRLADVFSAKNLDLLPNWAFGLALATARAAQASPGAADATTSFGGFGSGGGDDDDDDDGDHAAMEDLSSPASVALQDAMIKFPQVTLALLAKVESSLPAGDMSFFTAAAPATPSLDLVTQLFLERSAALWKGPAVVTWLRACASAVQDRANDPVQAAAFADLGQRVLDAYYGAPPDNVARHVIISEYNSGTLGWLAG